MIWYDSYLCGAFVEIPAGGEHVSKLYQGEHVQVIEDHLGAGSPTGAVSGMWTGSLMS